MTVQNRVFRLAERPEGSVTEDTFKLCSELAPELMEGEVRVAIDYLSLDPAMRTWIHDIDSYLPPVEIGEVMRAGAVGRIVETRSSKFAVGDVVQGLMGVQSIYSGSTDMLTKLELEVGSVPDFMGGLGGTGLAAYFGLLHVGEHRPGDVVVVSAAAGAVGHIAVQLAKLKGSKVIGIAGGGPKCRRVVETYGADACIDYKSEDLESRIKQLCPEGVDLYFDNVGGRTLEVMLNNLSFDARIVVSGAIGEYDNLSAVNGPSNYLNLIAKRGTMRGLLNVHWADQFEAARQELSEWRVNDLIRFDTQIETGFDRFPEVFAMLFSGANTGKLILKL